MYDADDEDATNGSRAPVKNIPAAPANKKKKKFDEATLRDFSNIIDNIDLPIVDLKKVLKNKLNEMRTLDELSPNPTKNRSATEKAIMDKFQNVLEEMALSKEDVDHILEQINDSMKKELNPARETVPRPLPDQDKGELINKVATKPPTSPIISTNKKGPYSDSETNESFSPSTFQGSRSMPKPQTRLDPYIEEESSTELSPKRKGEESSKTTSSKRSRENTPKMSAPNQNVAKGSTSPAHKQSREAGPFISTHKRSAEGGSAVSTPYEKRSGPKRSTEVGSTISSPYEKRLESRPKRSTEEDSAVSSPHEKRVESTPKRSTEEGSAVPSPYEKRIESSPKRSAEEGTAVSSPYEKRSGPKRSTEEGSTVSSPYEKRLESSPKRSTEEGSAVSSPHEKRLESTPKRSTEEGSTVSSPYEKRLESSPKRSTEEGSTVSSPYEKRLESSPKKRTEEGSTVSSPSETRLESSLKRSTEGGSTVSFASEKSSISTPKRSTEEVSKASSPEKRLKSSFKRRTEEGSTVSSPYEKRSRSSPKRSSERQPETSYPQQHRDEGREGPITSTPKKGRKSWRQATELSTIANEDTVPLTPEEQDLLEDILELALEDLPSDLDEETIKELMDGLALDMKKRQEYLLLNPEDRRPSLEELEVLQTQLFKKIIDVLDKEKNPDIPGKPKQIPRKILEDDIDAWVDKLPITINSSGEQQQFDKKKKHFKSKINRLLPKFSPDQLEAEIIRELRTWPLEPEMKQDEKYLGMKSKELVNTLSEITANNLSNILPEESNVSLENQKDMIHKWLDKLSLECCIEDPDEVRALKEGLASKLAQDLQEIDDNSEIFDDDYLYEENVREAVDSMIDELPFDGDIISDEKKKDLIDEILTTRRKATQYPGLLYKRQLKDTVSKTLPEQEYLSPDEQASFELLKDDVADAFISLTYTGDNENQKVKFKKRINDAVNQYCDDYLAKHPCAPLDHEQLKKDLYAALKEVPLPPEDSLQLEVESTRLKDIVNDWMAELPLKPQTPTESLETKKKASALARKLKEIEINDANLSESDMENAMGKEIKTFLKQIPLKCHGICFRYIFGQDKKIDRYSRKLIAKLKATAPDREFDASTRYSIDINDIDTSRSRGSVTTKDVCPYYTFLQDRLKQADTCEGRSKTTLLKQHLPPCTLSEEDREHLERIRQRSYKMPSCMSSLLRASRRNSSVSPMSVDAEVQTRPSCDNTTRYSLPLCPSLCKRVSRGSSVVSVRRTRSQCVQSDSHLDLEPQVIIKEYYWDSVAAPDREMSASELTDLPIHDDSTTRFSGIKFRRCPQCSKHNIFDSCQDLSSGPSLPYIRSPCFPRVPPLRPCSPRPCTPRTRRCPLSNQFMPSHQPSCQKPNRPFWPNAAYKGPKRNGLQTEYPEPSMHRHSGRQVRVIDLGSLGSLDHLRRPCQQKRPDDCVYSSGLCEDGTSCSRHESINDVEDTTPPCMRSTNEGKSRNRCMENLMANSRRWNRLYCKNNCNFRSNCNDDSVKQCPKCCGVSCPYPSHMFFK